MADIHKDRVVACNVSLLNSQMYSDIVIRCGREEYKLHRSIICPRSSFFAAACKEGFVEATTATITMNDDEPQTIKRMIFYLYTLDYPDHEVPNIQAERVAKEHSTSPGVQHKTSTIIEDVTNLSTSPVLSEAAATHDARMMNNVLVYAIAEKYDILELKQLAKGKFSNLVRFKWPHDDFLAVAEAVFSTTPDGDFGLRRIVLDICAEHFLDILKHEDSRAGLLEIQAIAAVVLGGAVRKIDLDEMLLDEALAKQIAVKEELSKAKAEADQKNKWISELDALFEKANNTRCTYCGRAENQSCLQRLGTSSAPSVQLSCVYCKRRQNVNL